MPRVAVIGAGLIGRSWSIVFARVGWDVALFDAAADAIEPACAMVARGLAELEEHGLIDLIVHRKKIRVQIGEFLRYFLPSQ